MSQFKIFPISTLLILIISASILMDFLSLLPWFIIVVGLNLVWFVDFVLAKDSDQNVLAYDSLVNWGATQNSGSSNAGIQSAVRIIGLVLVWTGIAIVVF